MFTRERDKNVRAVPVLSDNPLDPLADYKEGDVVGAFGGYLRRAKPSREGLTAQVFGENGHDADVISAMHLTRFQDAPVRVRIFMVKDSQGRLKRKMLCEFIAKIKRPSANDNGQVAQFFGDNGPNSDAINILNQSEFLDALVFVELTKPSQGEFVVLNPNLTPPEELEAESKRLVPSEVKILKSKQKKADEAMNILRREGFFRAEAVLQALGTEVDYTRWLEETQQCCHPGDEPCPILPVKAFRLDVASFRRYHYVPLCSGHLTKWTTGESGLQAPGAFLDSQQKRFVQAWAQYALRQALGIPMGFEPMPATVHAWAIDHGLKDYIPGIFLGFL